jgi:hypothetical protein
MSLFNQLKTGNGFRVVGAYLIIGWLLARFAGTEKKR